MGKATDSGGGAVEGGDVDPEGEGGDVEPWGEGGDRERERERR